MIKDMAGIYLHIPFCKKKCHYCDFYRSIDTGKTGRFLQALKKETELQKDYLDHRRVETIYFGGGTPSLLTAVQLRDILENIKTHFDVSPDAEITVEANPDDINKLYLRDIKRAGVNRISLGIQSWNDRILSFLNRRHTAAQAGQAIDDILNSGINNISCDLIYGIPGMTTEQWAEDLRKTLATGIKHLSAYHLTIEPGTIFAKMKAAGELKEIDETESEKQFNILVELSAEYGFTQYEISNFCKENYFSVHNTNYWRQEPYLGLGPSAHSFNDDVRQWNIADLSAYMRIVEKGEIPGKGEILTEKDLYNEYIMTSLRTMWGTDLDLVEEKINKEARDYLSNLASRLIQYGMIERNDNILVLTTQGKMISDNIISELMMA